MTWADGRFDMMGDPAPGHREHEGGYRGRMVVAGTISVPSTVRPFLVAGVGAVVAGGMIAAASRPAGWERGPWTAAFLVLVVGVGQVGLAIGQSASGRPVIDIRTIVVELVLVNVGASLVIAGTLSSSPVTATIGSVLFAVALVVFARQSCGRRGERGWLLRAYLALLLVLVVSTPIGIALSWHRA